MSPTRFVLFPFALLVSAIAGPVLGEGLTRESTLHVTPEKVSLRGPDSVQQLVIETPDGRDHTANAILRSDDPTIAAIGPDGRILARGEGVTRVRVSIPDEDRNGSRRESVIPVEVRGIEPAPPVHFANQVVPIFTKLACNSGGCHGKASGQNGFRLSLLGFEPAVDYETIVLEARGRRVFPASPPHSLLLRKAAGQVPHGGGRKLEPESAEYRLIARWIAEGMPVGSAEEPTVARIEVYPEAKTLRAGDRQQLAVTAIHTDGRREDVTRWSQFQTNDPEVATVEETSGRVEARSYSGQAAIMARYQGQVAVFRATVPLGPPTDSARSFATAGFVDDLVRKQWLALGLDPSEPCTDAEFLRRASLDITGTLPTAEQVQTFRADPDPDKRRILVDRLLESPDYASYFASRWADLLRNKRDGNAQLQADTHRFADWLRDRLATNEPYDRIVNEILTARGSSDANPAVLWTGRLRTPDAFVDDVGQVFLGMRLQCARCHHHPFEVWAEDDYYGVAAFFARVGRKTEPGSGRGAGESIHVARTGTVAHPKTGQVVPARGLGSAAQARIEPGSDPRAALASWLTAADNPFFARAIVNRYWAHFFGRGLVEPIDDMRVTNPPANPELLDALAADFIASGYDLKHLIRTLATSRVYGLSSVPTELNAGDRQSYARRYPKRLPAEVLLDAIGRVSGSPPTFAGLPPGTRAIELPDESVASSFLDTFGRPRRDSACECERVGSASLGQSLALLNSAEIQARIGAAGGLAETLAQADGPSDDIKISSLFWSAFGREPTGTERAAALDHLSRHDSGRRREAFEDLLWALVNAKEFQFSD
jgi:hypothetical protein